MMRQEEYSVYTSPFSARYASREMSFLFSPRFKALTFRRLWIALAKGQHRLGLPISRKQIAEMEKNLESIDFSQIQEYEKRFRHDIMAHIHAFADLCPDAKGIIHLGATSTYVTDNGDLIQIREALKLLLSKLIFTLRLLASFAKKHARLSCLGFTHFQAAQPTTLGKRASLWLQDFLLDAQEWERLLQQLPFLGAKGATGTQSSFLSLFKGDSHRVCKLEELIAKEFDFTKVLPIAGQTYTRKLDLNVLNALESFAASAHKMATDIRLLAHEGELLESFEKTQVGSSAMPHKRNPIYSERICGLARFVISLSQNSTYTTATQWLERSLDDSSNRRFSLPESFLGTDALLNLLAHLLSSLTPVPEIAAAHLREQIPFLAMENVLMAAVKKGGDRQKLHEKLRHITLAARKKRNPLPFLLAAIEKDREFQLKRQEIQPFLKVSSLIGRAPQQVLEFLKTDVQPFLNRYRKVKAPLSPVEF